MFDIIMTSSSHALPQVLVATIGGHLSGSVPFGLILTRLSGLGDIRAIGSGNIGATNVLRTGNKKIAALTLLLDALKGLIPVVVAKQVHIDLAVMAGICALLGHIFPVWLKFKGGKGVATGLGVLLGLYLDHLWSFAPWGLLLGIVLGTVAAVASVVQLVRRFL